MIGRRLASKVENMGVNKSMDQFHLQNEVDS
jgi:hypothetical protein